MDLASTHFTFRNEYLRIVPEESAKLVPEISTQYEEAQDESKVGNQAHDDAMPVIARDQIGRIYSD